MKLEIPVTDMTPQVMEQLEKDGLILRLCPGHERLEAPKGETTWRLMYEPKEGFGPHRLITIRVNREPFAGFGTHPDCEEFWLIGSEDTQPMYLAICRLGREALEKAGYEFVEAEVKMIPQTMVELTDEDALKNMQRLLDMLDDNDDVQNVWHNWDE